MLNSLVFVFYSHAQPTQHHAPLNFIKQHAYPSDDEEDDNDQRYPEDDEVDAITLKHKQAQALAAAQGLFRSVLWDSKSAALLAAAAANVTRHTNNNNGEEEGDEEERGDEGEGEDDEGRESL